MKKATTLFVFTIFFVLVFHHTRAFSQASLASEDIIENVPIIVSGEKIIYSLVRDGNQKNQWYYIPSQVRLFETERDGTKEPEFTLIKYQFKNPKNPQELLEGGVIQFSVSMSPDNDGFNQLRNFITKKTGNPNVRLGALPLKRAEVTLLTPKGEFLATGVETTGIAPTMANNKMAFSVDLSKIGADVYEALANSNTGMGVAVKYTYNGFTPPAGFKVTVDWDETYKFLSKNELVRKKIGYSGVWSSLGIGLSAKYASEKQEIKQSLIDNKCITIEAILGEKFNDTAMEKYLGPLIAKITEELYKRSEYSNKTDSLLLAEALDADPQAPTKGKDGKDVFHTLKASYQKSIALKDISKVKTGKQTYTFNVKQLVDRLSVAGGFVGVGKYSDDIKKKLIVLVPEGRWESAFFLLPSVADNEDIGIRQVDLQIGLKSKDKAYNTQAVVWTKEKGWTDKDGRNRTVISFPLMELAKNDPLLKNLKFDVTGSITMGNDVLKIKQQVEASSGEAHVSAPMSLVDIVSVQPDLLSFSKLSPESNLDFVNVFITDGDRKFSKKLMPFSKGGTPEAPKPLYWLVAKNKNSAMVKADITFNLKDGSEVKWKNSQKNLYDAEVGLDIVLRDIDTKSN